MSNDRKTIMYDFLKNNIRISSFRWHFATKSEEWKSIDSNIKHTIWETLYELLFFTILLY